MEHVDVLVVGGGVAGLASAAAVAEGGATVVVVDRHPRAGMETSTHNSGVIHAGLYYPAGSLKARLCVEGRDRLYEFCARRGVPHARTGKLVVAGSDEEVPQLEALLKRAHGNGVTDVTMILDGEIGAHQPGLRARVALLSPSTGIVASDALVGALLQECRDREVGFLPATPLVDAARSDGGFDVHTPRETFHARVVVNAAGLYADDVSRMMGGDEFRIYPCRGEYAELSARRHAQIKMPVYPLPHASGHGLGTHVTPTIWGPILLGPTVRYQDRKDDYESDRLPLETFLEAARSLLTDVEMADLRLGGTGIRAKFHPPEESFADFHIAHDTRAPGLIHAAGIDSPGLTSCLAIGEMVARLVTEML
jgi:glycerol-3-phosphate dehydrogenase